MSEIKGFMSPSLQHAIAKDHGALEGERNDLRAERDQLRQQVEKLRTVGSELLEASADAHPHTATSHQPRLYRANHAMKKALDQVRKELEGRC